MLPKIAAFQNEKQNNLLLIAGPCIIENDDMAFAIAASVSQIALKYKIPFIFKGSYRKANRSRIDSFSGIGDQKALSILKSISSELGIPVTTDIHSAAEAEMAAQYVDVLQIPAFLCRQTDLLIAAAQTGKYVNIKKGQFLSAASMQFAVEKVRNSGNPNIMLTERGNFFGYNDLVVDYRGIPEMKKNNCPVILDITHSLQQPNQSSGVTGGQPELIETIAMAGIAAGIDGVFVETHPEPHNALSDGANMLQLGLLENLIGKLVKLKMAVDQV